MNPTEPRLLRVEIVADLPVLWATLNVWTYLPPWTATFPRRATGKGRSLPARSWPSGSSSSSLRATTASTTSNPGSPEHQGTLSALLGKTVLPVHLHDDRLADWLNRLGAGDSFSVLERDLNQQTIRVYQLPTDTCASTPPRPNPTPMS